MKRYWIVPTNLIYKMLKYQVERHDGWQQKKGVN